MILPNTLQIGGRFSITASTYQYEMPDRTTARDPFYVGRLSITAGNQFEMRDRIPPCELF